MGIEKENGLGPESKMVVLHDFTPCVDDELEVKRGQVSEHEITGSKLQIAYLDRFNTTIL